MVNVSGMNPDVDAYIARTDGWPAEIVALREILLSCGLTEEIKWGKPCYGSDGKNLAIMQEMKNFLALMFFKGTLLEDKANLLHNNGPNSRSAKRLQFTSVDEVTKMSKSIKAYVSEAIDIEEAGLEVGPAPAEPIVAELQHKLDADDNFRAAFEALTPGRQREYNLYFSSAKQASTREARVQKYAPKILDGKGFRDR